MTDNEAALAAMAPGDTEGGTIQLSESVEVVEANRQAPATRVQHRVANRVTWRIGKPPNGDLHLLHFAPRAD